MRARRELRRPGRRSVSKPDDAPLERRTRIQCEARFRIAGVERSDGCAVGRSAFVKIRARIGIGAVRSRGDVEGERSGGHVAVRCV